MTGTTPAERIAAFGVGTRVVIRYRVGELATDALGELVEIGPTTCTVVTRRGPQVIAFSDVVAAKTVPPPPAPRRRVHETGGQIDPRPPQATDS